MDGTPSIPANMNAMQAPQAGHNGTMAPAGSPPEPAAVIEQFGGDQRRSVDRLVAGLKAYYEPQLRQARQAETEARRKLGEEECRSKELAEQLGETQQIAANLHIQNGDLKRENDGLKAKVRDGEAAVLEKDAKIERLLAENISLQTKYESLENSIKGTFGHMFQGNQGGSAGSAAEPVTPRSEPAAAEERRASPAASEPGPPEQRASPSLSPPPPARPVEPVPKPEEEHGPPPEPAGKAAAEVFEIPDSDDEEPPSSAVKSPTSATQGASGPAKGGRNKDGPVRTLQRALRQHHRANGDPASGSRWAAEVNGNSELREAVLAAWAACPADTELGRVEREARFLEAVRGGRGYLWERYEPGQPAPGGPAGRSRRGSGASRGSAGGGPARRRRSAAGTRDEVPYWSDGDEPEAEESGEEEAMGSEEEETDDGGEFDPGADFDPEEVWARPRKRKRETSQED